MELPFTAVKEAVLPFVRFPGVDTLLGPEMSSTGEVHGDRRRFRSGVPKAESGGARQRADTRCDSSSPSATRTKRNIIFPAKRLAELGFRSVRDGRDGRSAAARERPVTRVEKDRTGIARRRRPVTGGKVDLIVNHPNGTRAAHRWVSDPEGRG